MPHWSTFSLPWILNPNHYDHSYSPSSNLFTMPVHLETADMPVIISAALSSPSIQSWRTESFIPPDWLTCHCTRLISGQRLKRIFFHTKSGAVMMDRSINTSYTSRSYFSISDFLSHLLLFIKITKSEETWHLCMDYIFLHKCHTLRHLIAHQNTMA